MVVLSTAHSHSYLTTVMSAAMPNTLPQYLIMWSTFLWNMFPTGNNPTTSYKHLKYKTDINMFSSEMILVSSSFQCLASGSSNLKFASVKLKYLVPDNLGIY